jgi:hypothetical protein
LNCLKLLPANADFAIRSNVEGDPNGTVVTDVQSEKQSCVNRESDDDGVSIGGRSGSTIADPSDSSTALIRKARCNGSRAFSDHLFNAPGNFLSACRSKGSVRLHSQDERSRLGGTV